ncbi:cubilin-like isoform X3 [Montipora capricornis]|uniref:cubilin-like isoform X3 n=1 Tax=Montipora capricornis TaxID=246305 RepID=UPI0035F10BEE
MRLYVLAHVIVLISVRLILADDDCGSVQNNTLRSPGYPNNYPSNMDCVYRVPIPLDQELEIYFKDFKLENSWNYCPYDYLRISNDRNHIIGTYCGVQTGLRVLITSSAAVLSFHSDGSVQFRGFDLSFSFLPLGNTTLRPYSTQRPTTTPRPSIFSSTTVAPTTTPSVILPSGPSALNPTSIQTILPQTPSAPDCGSFRNNTLRSPGYPNNYARNMDCVYRVPIPFDQKLVIYFNFFELERHRNCWYDYLRIRNDRNHIIGTYCGLQTGRSVLITSSAAVLSFHSDGVFQYRGFDLSFSFLPLGNTTLRPYSTQRPTTTPRPSIFSPTTVAQTTTPSMILPSGPSTLNTTSIQTILPQTPSASGCGSFRNNTLRSPGYPNNYPRNMDCVYRVPIPFDQKLVIYFNFFELERHWNCRYDYLRISNDRNHIIGTYCGVQTGLRVLITSRAAVLTFHSDGSVQFRGFDLSLSFLPLGIFSSTTVAPTTTPSVILPSGPSALNPTSIQTTSPQTPSAPDCGSFRNNILRSPGYPNNYPRNMDCVYRVPIPFDQKLVIYFNVFELEHHWNCWYDYLRISNDRNHIIGTYCGLQTGRSVLITSSAAVLSFHSDGSVQYRGFDLSFSFIPLGIFSSTTVAQTTTPSVILPSGPSTLNSTSIQTSLPQTPSAPDCGSFRNNTLRSPGYPNDYPRNMDCVYRVPIPFDQKLVIYFNFFYLESAGNCVFDYLKISNDRNLTIGTYCGLETGLRVLITSSAAVLSFHSDGSFQYRGFDLSFSFIPLGNTTLRPHSTQLPTTTPRPSIFSSTTVAPTTTPSVILPSGPSALNPTSIQTILPQTPSAPDCGSFRNNTLRSPGYPNNYPRNMDCVYRVPIPFDQKLVIYFNFFELERHWNCWFDYLRISNDRNHIIGTYCGLQTGRSVLITSSAAVLSFHSDGSAQYRGFDLSFSFLPLGIFSSTTVAPTTTPSVILPSGPSTLNSTSFQTTPPQTPSAPDCGPFRNNTLRSPGYPNYYPRNMDCVYRVPIPFDQKLVIYFNYFYLPYSWNCVFNYLRISNDRNHTIGTYCSWETGRRVLITSSAAVLSFHSDGSFQYRGFDLSFSFIPLGIFSSTTVAPTTTPSVILPSGPSALNPTSIQTILPQTPSAPDCGSFRNNILRSPGYPNNYPRNMDCVYRVPIPFDQKLVIYFNFFELERYWSCRYDYLRISNDRNHIIGTYCGLQTGLRVLITSSAAVLSFHSDGSVQYRGFDLSFSFIPLGIFSSRTVAPTTTPSVILPSEPSALNLTSIQTTPPQTPSAPDCGSFRNNILRSPGYPNNYPRNMDCVYRVPIPFDQKLVIYFNFFNLVYTWKCWFDYLRISNDRNHTIGKYCGVQTGRSVLITGSAVVLSFHSDWIFWIFQNRGFDLHFSFFPLGIFSSATIEPNTTPSPIASGPSALSPTPPPPPPPPPPQTPSARDIFALTRVKPNTTTSQIASGPSTLKSTSPQAPPPHRPLPLRSYNSFSRIPPDERRKESVVLSVTGLNISEWHQEMKRNFKKEVARAATEYCSVKQAECRSVLVSSPRWTFSPDMVHILPGYPKKSSDDPNVAMIAFYLSLPRESSQSIAVGKDVLTNIVKSNMPSIGRCLGSSIVAVEPLNSPLQEFPTNDDKIREFTAAKIIGASLFGGLFLVIIILVRFVKKKRRPFIFKDNFQPDGKLEALEMKGVPVAFSDASPKSTKWSASTRNQSATSQSINVHPSAFHDHSKSLVNHAHQAERDDSIEPEREVEWLEKSSELWKDQVAASVPSDELNLACLSVVPRDHPESSVNQVCQDSDEEEDKNKRNDAGPLKKSQDSNTVTI